MVSAAGLKCCKFSMAGVRRNEDGMNQKSYKDILHKRFSDLKKELDPSKSYLIFENDVKKMGNSILSGDLPVYEYLERHQFIWQKIEDSQIKREYLIVQTEPGNEDDTLGRLMVYQMPREVTYFVYKATPEDSGG